MTFFSSSFFVQFIHWSALNIPHSNFYRLSNRLNLVVNKLRSNTVHHQASAIYDTGLAVQDFVSYLDHSVTVIDRIFSMEVQICD